MSPLRGFSCNAIFKAPEGLHDYRNINFMNSSPVGAALLKTPFMVAPPHSECNLYPNGDEITFLLPSFSPTKALPLQKI
jgi:hypothetical protein